MTSKKKQKFYAVARGRRTGIFTDWPTAARQVQGYPKARYKSFFSRDEAEAFITGGNRIKSSPAQTPVDTSDRLIVYTDGGARGNPGPGGYGAVIAHSDGYEELSGGYRLTTNNRMELMACIAALERLKKFSRAALHSDSSYVVNAVNKGWAKSWKARGWKKADGKPALNPDLWDRLLALCEIHDVLFIKVKGHAGIELNERCDRLANKAMDKKRLPPDTFYERLVR